MNTVYTIGHSTRPISEFIELLQSQRITQLVDIRTIPRSRHNPQYAAENLPDSLKNAGIRYAYLRELGGLRRKAEHSKNEGWRNKSFRNYADYMQTEDFATGIKQLLQLAEKELTALMCAEAVPWRCHRSLVGDALVVRDVHVIDIISLTSQKEHTLTSFAHVEDTRITYPPYEA